MSADYEDLSPDAQFKADLWLAMKVMADNFYVGDEW